MEVERTLLDGKVLHGEDRFGIWKINALEGWWDSPDAKSQDEPRTQADGDYDLPLFYQSRFITITGSFRANGHEALHHGMTRFSGLIPKSGRLQVFGHGDLQWADVKRASALTITPMTDTFAQWQARLKAPDSRKFGLTRSEPLVSELPRSLYHYGNSVSSPLVRVFGPITGGYTLSSNDGRQYKVSGGIASGITHEIDMNDGLLRVGGRVQAGLVSRGDIWDIPPGNGLNMALFADTGSATGEVIITDTYI